MKIAVIGYSGSGKSTLAKFLCDKLGFPLLYLDTIQYVENWQLRDRNEAKDTVLKFMKNNSWVIDGNYYGFYSEQRWMDADEIVF